MDYTRGEWKVKRKLGVLRVAINGDKPEICDLIGGIEENAQLIAAAPDLYEALKAVDATVIVNGDMSISYAIDGATRKLIDMAIAKAESKDAR